MSMNPSTTVIDTAASPPRHYPNTLENNYLQELWEPIAKLDPRLPRQWDLKPQHQKYLADRGIDLESACYAGIFSASGELAKALVGRPDSCLVFSYFEPYGRKLYTWKHPTTGVVQPFYRARLDIPPDGKQRFTSPPKSRVFPYWPRVRGFSWLDTPSMGRQIPSSLKGKNMLVTEGEAKALCGTIHGFPTVGLGGIWGWVKTKDKNDRDASSNQLLEELYDFDWSEPRQIIGVFDSDASHNPLVVQAMGQFVKCLVEAWEERKSQGSKMPQYYFAQQINKKLKFILLPTSLHEKDDEEAKKNAKNGLDDFIVKFQAKGLKELVDNALPLQTVKVDKGELKITCHYTGELLGSYSPAKGGLDKVHATYYRGLLTYFTLAEDVRYVPGYGGFQYDGEKGIWEPMKREKWESLPDAVCDANNWQNRKRALKQENFDLAKGRLMTSYEKFNHPKYTGFQNGVRVREGDNTFFVSHNRKYLLTRRLGFNFDKKAKCPEFEEFLKDRCKGRNSSFWVIQSLFRWSVEPKKKGEKYGLEVWPILLGPPGSGKGTLLSILEALVGGNEGAASFSIKCFSGTDPEKKMGALEDKYVTIDSDYKGHLDPATLGEINKVISNEPVRIKRLWKEPYDATLNTVLWAAANKNPSVSNSDGEGFGRRAVIIPIAPRKGKADPYLLDNLKKELPGIYNWVMEVSVKAVVGNVENFRNSDAAFEALKAQIRENNPAISWLEEWVEDSTEEERVGYFNEYYECYKEWCKDNGHKNVFTKKKFSGYMNAAGAVKMKEHRGKGCPWRLPKIEEIKWRGVSGEDRKG